MRLEHLYRLRFGYEAIWQAGSERFGIAEGRCDGRIAGRFRGANTPRIREDGLYLPDLDGWIETGDDEGLLVAIRGRGRVLDDGSFAATGTVTHVSDAAAYRWLNDAVCVLEATSGTADDEVTVDVYELVRDL